MIELRTHSTLSEIGAREWDGLLGPDPVPYLRYHFLNALETTGCVEPRAGWAPFHISIHDDDELVAAAPAYVKGNSDGEFVFDHSWAQFAYDQLGVEYYPKLIVACPFTPATGPRVLIKPSHQAAGASGDLFAALAQGLRRVVQEVEVSSAHVLFSHQAEAEALRDEGLALRMGVQYHWVNHGYASFDNFLERYNSKRRNQIRRERRELAKQGIELQVKTGSDVVPEVVDHAYTFYCATVSKYFWGRQYLNRAFFEEVCAVMPENVLIVLAREVASGKVVGGAFNLMGGGRLFGRYWGATGELRHLHFNVCYYQGIEECIARGLEVFEPGAGGDHKVARGFEPTLTFSLHHLADPQLDRAVRDFLRRERQAVRRRVALEPPVLRTGSSE